MVGASVKSECDAAPRAHGRRSDVTHCLNTAARLCLCDSSGGNFELWQNRKGKKKKSRQATTGKWRRLICLVPDGTKIKPVGCWTAFSQSIPIRSDSLKHFLCDCGSQGTAADARRRRKVVTVNSQSRAGASPVIRLSLLTHSIASPFYLVSAGIFLTQPLIKLLICVA